MQHVGCQAALGSPILTGDGVLMGAGATFGCAVLEQKQLLERAPAQKARRERKLQGNTISSQLYTAQAFAGHWYCSGVEIRVASWPFKA